MKEVKQTIPRQPSVEINPYAVLAAVLFNINKTELVKVKPDDASPEVEMEVRSVGVETEDDACICVIPIEKILHYMQHPHSFRLRVEDGHAILSFEKQSEIKQALFAANGQKLISQEDSPAIKRLREKLI